MLVLDAHFYQDQVRTHTVTGAIIGKESRRGPTNQLKEPANRIGKLKSALTAPDYGAVRSDGKRRGRWCERLWVGRRSRSHEHCE